MLLFTHIDFTSQKSNNNVLYVCVPQQPFVGVVIYGIDYFSFLPVTFEEVLQNVHVK